MYKLLLVSVFGNVEADTNERVNSLYDLLLFKVKIVTTDFSHRDKRYKTRTGYRDTDYIHVTSYKGNLSISRLISHCSFAVKLFFYIFVKGKNYDIIYCISPTPSSAFVCALYKILNRRKVLVIDIIDIWPESLIPVASYLKFLSPFFYLWKSLSIVAYKAADAIIGATQYYQSSASRYNKSAFTKFYPLGIDYDRDLSSFEEPHLKISKATDEIWIAYAGNLGAAYDFDAMINAVKFTVENSFDKKIRLIFIGGGEREVEIKEKLSLSGISYLITGNIKYGEYLSYLKYCDIGLNIFIANTKVIQSYKFNDYVLCGLFIINNLRGETSDIIQEYNIGCNVFSLDIRLKEALLEVVSNWDSLKSRIKSDCQKVINERLSKKLIYENLSLDLIKVAEMKLRTSDS